MNTATCTRRSTSDEELAELLLRTAANDESAFSRLFALMRGRVQSAVNRLVRDTALAEDVTQEVFRQVWQQAGNFHADRCSATGWLLMIAHSRALDVLRRTRRHRYDEPIEHAEYPSPDAQPDREFDRTCRARTLRQLVAALPAAQRTAVGLAFYEGCTHLEIADRTGVPLGTIKSRIRVALRRMKSTLETADAVIL